MSSADDRRAARSTWPIRRIALAEEGSDADVGAMTPEARMAMVWQLTVDAWASSGKPLPTYSRAETPARMVRGYSKKR